MSITRHILRLYAKNQTQSEIAVQTGIRRSVLKTLIQQFKGSGLSFSEIDALNDKDIDELFGTLQDTPKTERLRILYDLFPVIDKELKRTGVTRRLLWEEYKKKNPEGAGITAFLFHFARWKARVSPIMRREHKAGDKLYIDFAGEKLSIVDNESGESKPVEVFVAVLGASQLAYAQAVMTQQKEDFIPACEDALHYFGGAPAAMVPDNLKSAVTKCDRFEPTINETFADFAQHYNTTVVPARKYQPTDKALVEITINILYTRVYAKLRTETFYSLDELNKAILIHLEEHNNLPLTGRDYSRRQKFEEIEQKTLLPLPAIRYEFKKQIFATVMKNGHVCLSPDKHYYSVPYGYIGKRVKILFSRYVVEAYIECERIAIHQRIQSPWKYTTDKEHLPSSHRFVAELESDRLLQQASEIHKDVQQYISKVLSKTPHEEQGHKICLGILHLGKKNGAERLTKACQRALDYEIYSYDAIKKILDKGLDKFNHAEKKDEVKMPEHDNIRGREYYS
jgi:transposase